MAERLEYSIRVCPVSVKSIGDSGCDNTFDLCDAVLTRERFPAIVSDSGAYTLSLTTEVASLSELPEATKRLDGALELLCQVWPFASGFSLPAFERQTKKTSLVESNTEEVRAKLSHEAGVVTMSHSVTCNSEISNPYPWAPLSCACELAKAVTCDSFLESMLRYYYLANFEDECWFIHLYKIRDCLQTKASDSKLVQAKEEKLGDFVSMAFGVSFDRWDEFSANLNKLYDLRHYTKKYVGPLPLQKKNTLLQIGYLWVWKYAHKMGYSVVPI